MERGKNSDTPGSRPLGYGGIPDLRCTRRRKIGFLLTHIAGLVDKAEGWTHMAYLRSATS